MEYETWLPATHLRSERLVELEELLCADATDPDLSVVLEYESVTYAYESADRSGSVASAQSSSSSSTSRSDRKCVAGSHVS